MEFPLDLYGSQSPDPSRNAGGALHDIPHPAARPSLFPKHSSVTCCGEGGVHAENSLCASFVFLHKNIYRYVLAYVCLDSWSLEANA